LNEKKKEAKGGLNQSESSIDEFLNEDELEFNDLVLDQVNQNVLLYYKTITEQAKE
jgi:galactokinase/mevalonate kinase-like predicted kinase